MVDSVLVNDLLDCFLALSEGVILPSSFIVVVEDVFEGLLVALQQLELLIAHLLVGVQLKLIKAHFLYLTHSHQQTFFKEHEYLIILNVILYVLL